MFAFAPAETHIPGPGVAAEGPSSPSSSLSGSNTASLPDTSPDLSTEAVEPVETVLVDAFEEILEKIKNELGNLEQMWKEDRTMVTGLYQFLKLLGPDGLDPTFFLPWLMFIDAVRLKAALKENSNRGTKPSKNCRIYLSMGYRYVRHTTTSTNS